MLGIEDVTGVAYHPHHAQMPKQSVLFLLGERPAFGGEGQAGHNGFVVVVFALLLGAQFDEKVTVGAFGQLGFHLRLASAQHVRLDALMELEEVAVA